MPRLELAPHIYMSLYSVGAKSLPEAQWSSEGRFTDEQNAQLGLHITSLRERIAAWAGKHQHDFTRILSGTRSPDMELQPLLSDLAMNANALALGNQQLIDFVLNSSPHAPSLNLQDREDLRQEGFGGLLHAALNYDPNHLGSEHKFSPYAVQCIKGQILAALPNLETIRLPRYATDKYYDYQRIRAALWIYLEREPTHTDVVYIMYLSSQLGRAPTAADVNTLRQQIDSSSRRYDNSVRKSFVNYAKRIMAVVRAKKQVTSLDSPQRRSIRNEAGELEEIDDAVDDEWTSSESLVSDLGSPEDHLFLTMLQRDLNETMKILNPREREVLELRFGLHDGRDWSLDEIAQHYDFTSEHVRQIEAQALRKLRHPSRSNGLRDYLT